MTAKKAQPLSTAHTAGIFSDMSIDGPEIGTLVMVVDKAKNLPNRKSIGKQDPYCAARLGKEAKKTTTDVRGGQTPKWDQELRFTVHDCPDYYQLKVSVFNDDKKTELIGETWIDLRDIIVSGGGQSDKWHTLNFRSKYAGEIRLEITFYDSRPKPEKPVAKPKLVQSDVDSAAGSGPGGQQGRAPKRRPLPSEPPNGPVPSQPAPAPPASHPQDHAQTPSRPQPQPQPQPNTPNSYIPTQSPLQSVEYNTPSPSARHHRQSVNSPAGPVDGGYSTPTRRPDIPPQHQHHQNHHVSPERHDKYSAHPEEADFGAREDHFHYSNARSHASSAPYDRPEGRASVDGVHDRYDYRDGGHMDGQRHMPLEEDRPPPPPAHRSRGSTGSALEISHRNSFDAGQKGTPPSMRHGVLRSEAHRQSLSSGSYPGRPQYRPYDSAPAASTNGSQFPPTDDVYQPSAPRHHSYDSAYDHNYRSMQPTVEDDPDPASPPIANSFGGSTSRRPQQQQQYDETDFNPVTPPAPLNIGGRNGSSSTGQYSHSSGALVSTKHDHNRHNPSSYNGNHHSVSPAASRNDFFSASPEPLPSIDRYQTSPGSPLDYHQRSPGPYGANDHHQLHQVSPGTSPSRDHPRHHTSPAPGPSSTRDEYQTNPAPGSYSYQTPTRRPIEYRNELEDTHVQLDRTVPSVPPSLVPGVDPGLATELSPRVNEDRRNDRRYNSAVSTPTRGPQMGDYGYSHNGSPHQFSTPQQSFDRGPAHAAYASSGQSPSVAVVVRPRGISSNPAPPQNQHTIRRKSVSPAPPPTEERERRLSGVPFGPDSFDELNPKVAAVAAKENAKRPHDFDEKTGKIITHDGREIDPSDHLPMDTWAPEPEPKQPKSTPQHSGNTNSAGQSPLGGGLPMGPSGRRQLRVAVRAQSMSPVTYGSGNGPGQPGASSTMVLPQYGNHNTSPSGAGAAASGRNRLQKKTPNRPSIGVSGSGAVGSQPLAPLPQPHQQDNYTPPRVQHRSSTFDYQQQYQQPRDENHAPLVLYSGGRGGMDGSPSGGGRMGSGGGSYNGPPIPAKIPIGSSSSSSSPYYGYGGPDGGGALMSGALPAPDGGSQWRGGSGGDLALMEEMRRIDIGAGRARRHGGY